MELKKLIANDEEKLLGSCEKIIDSINANASKPWISVEFFPPKTNAGDILLPRISTRRDIKE